MKENLILIIMNIFINKEIKVNKNDFSLELKKYEKFCVNMVYDFRLANKNKNIGDCF